MKATKFDNTVQLMQAIHIHCWENNPLIHKVFPKKPERYRCGGHPCLLCGEDTADACEINLDLRIG